MIDEVDVGRTTSREECLRRWQPWTPNEVRDRLANLAIPWGVTAGWAIDMFLGQITRAHEDIEITIPAAAFDEVAVALHEFEWDVVGSGRIWSYPGSLDLFHQTWLRDPKSGAFHLDAFREPISNGVWSYRRDPAISLPTAEVFARTPDGIPFVVPEVVLLFKSRNARTNDEVDFQHVLPRLSDPQRERLRLWIARSDPAHVWLSHLQGA